MSSTNRWTARYWPYVALGVAATVLVASHTPVGAALSMDSLLYLSTAKNVLAGNGIAFETYALAGPAVQETTIWPPLYPVLVAGITWLANLVGTSDVVAIAVFNGCALIVSLILVVRIAGHTASINAGVMTAVAVLISPSLQLVHTYAWSEVVFIPLSLAAYLSFLRYLIDDENRELRWLCSMVLLLGLATYTRYVGLAFFAAAALALLYRGRGDWQARLRATVAASVMYLVIIGPMLIRNYAVSGSLSGGDRGTPATNVLSDLSTLGWYAYLEFLNVPPSWALSVLAIGVTFAALLLLRSSGKNTESKVSHKSPRMIVPFIFVACYLTFLLASRSRQVVDLDTRMLSVAVPFILIGLMDAHQWLSIRTRSGLAAVPFLLLLTVFSISAMQTHTNILKGWRDLGEPGQILGMNHRSVTGRQLDTLRGIKAYFAPAAGDLILTDIARPLIVGYLFPNSDVRRFPDVPNEENLSILDAPFSRHGIAIVSTTIWSEALSTTLEGRAEFYKIESRNEGPEYMVIKLPVAAQ